MISMTVSFYTGGCGRPWACLWYSWLVISPKTDWVVSKTVHEQNRYFWIFNEYRILAYPNHIYDSTFWYCWMWVTLGMSVIFVDSHISQNRLSSVHNCIVFRALFVRWFLRILRYVHVLHGYCVLGLSKHTYVIGMVQAFQNCAHIRIWIRNRYFGYAQRKHR